MESIKMPAERFFIDAELKGAVLLEGAELHHLAHVMRVREGEMVELVNGRGDLAKGKVLRIEKRGASLEVIEMERQEIPSSRVHLAIPFMRMGKLEWVIEKGTELGADAFWLYSADHSEKEDFSEHQQERLKHIAISAMKQCGRLDLPQIKIVPFQELFKHPGAILFGDVRSSSPIPSLPNGPVLFITGPEKGFSPKEIAQLDQKGKGVSLHKNILRAETAPLVAAILLTHNFSSS